MKAAVAVLALLAASARDLAATPRPDVPHPHAPRPAAPCRDCLLAVPDHPVGLLVVLHGEARAARAAMPGRPRLQRELVAVVAWRVALHLGHAAMHAALHKGRAAEVVSWLVDAR